MPMSRLSIRLCLTLPRLLVLALVAACSDPTAPKAVPGDLLFLSNQLDGTLYYGRPYLALHGIAMDGTGARTVVGRPDLNFGYDVSRDGSRIVVSGPEADIWTTDVAGSPLVRLTNRGATRTDGSNFGPRWSPDGTRIAFLSNREKRQYGYTIGVYDVYVMHADGSNPRNLSSPLGDAVGFSPQVLGWTPAGEVIFQANDVLAGVVRRRVYTAKADGSGVRPLLPEGDAMAIPSPDGRRIAFVRGEYPASRVHVMNADGTGVKALSFQDGDHLDTRSMDANGLRDPWSPDGRTIVFRRTGAGEGLYVVNVDGTGLRRVVPGYGAKFGSWSPAGDRISFSMDGDIHTISVTGTDLQNVTRSPGITDVEPVWLRR